MIKKYYEFPGLTPENFYEKDGDYKFYNPDGQLIAHVRCKAGKLHGEYVFYYSNGAIMDRGVFN